MKINNQLGYSLIELMVAISVSSVITYATFTVMRAGNEQMYATNAKMTIQDGAREGLYKMTQEIRLSASNQVVIAEDGKSIEFVVPDSAVLADENFEVDWTNAHTIRYELDTENQQLLRIVDGDEDNPTILMNDITDVSFEGDADEPNVVSATVELERELASGHSVTENIDVTLNAELRNPPMQDEEEEVEEGDDSSEDTPPMEDSGDDSGDSGSDDSGDSGSGDSGDSGSGDSSGDSGSDSGDSGNNGNGNSGNNGNSGGNGNGKWKW